MSATFAEFFLLLILLLLLFSCYSCTFHTSINLPTHFSDDANPSFSSRSIPVEVIYQFGDSISDTGNLIRDDPSNCESANWPYGETFFAQPTGRFCDGLLMIDYFAKFMNLPFVDAYLNKDGNFTHGVNFAVAGATAINASTLNQRYHIRTTTNHSFSYQLHWFKSHLRSFYPNVSGRRKMLSKALFMMGGIGGNDYNYAFLAGNTLPNVYQMVPHVIQVITNAVKEIIELGGTHIVVPGCFPIGCSTMFLELFKTNDSSMYDDRNCLKQYNEHAKFHNDLLQQTISKLRMDHPHVAIAYMDYYGVTMQIVQNAATLGFDENVLQERCCGSLGRNCGTKGAPVCKNPREYMSWDGLHLTQQAYHVMARKLMHSIFLAFQNVAYDLKAIE